MIIKETTANNPTNCSKLITDIIYDLKRLQDSIDSSSRVVMNRMEFTKKTLTQIKELTDKL